MIGIDIIEIKRIEKSLKSGNFYERIFTQNERAYYEKNNKSPQTLAGIFAAKEAVAKALGTGFKNFLPIDIEIVHNDQNAPLVLLHKNAAELLKDGFKIFVSISHSDTTAVAAAVILKYNQGE